MYPWGFKVNNLDEQGMASSGVETETRSTSTQSTEDNNVIMKRTMFLQSQWNVAPEKTRGPQMLLHLFVYVKSKSASLKNKG